MKRVFSIKAIAGIFTWVSASFVAFAATPAFATAAAASTAPQQFKEGDISTLLERLARSFEGVPGMISAVAYLSGIILAVTAILKLKQHIDDPNNTPIREVMARGIIAGALFALPEILDVVMATIGPAGGGEKVRSLTTGGNLGGHVTSALGVNACDANRALNVLNNGLSGAQTGGLLGAIKGAAGTYISGGTLGQLVCYTSHAFQALPGILSTALYLSGLILVVWGLYQLRDFMLKPDNTPVSQPIKKFLLAGAFFAFPYVTSVVTKSVSDGKALVTLDPFVTASCTGTSTTGGIISAVSTIFNMLTSSGGGGGSSGNSGMGLDCMMVRLVSDLWGPVTMAVSIFAYVAGLILIALALRRMLDNMDKGVKSPVGMGTIAMIVTGGCLLSFDTFLRAVTVSLVPDVFSTLGVAKLNLAGSLAYAPGVSAGGLKSINTIITTVFAFSFLVGIISIVRGLFILKEVANGGNASLMAGFTHVIGGGMAVNLGAVVQAVQNTLGLQGIGIKSELISGVF